MRACLSFLSGLHFRGLPVMHVPISISIWLRAPMWCRWEMWLDGCGCGEWVGHENQCPTHLSQHLVRARMQKMQMAQMMHLLHSRPMLSGWLLRMRSRSHSPSVIVLEATSPVDQRPPWAEVSVLWKRGCGGRSRRRRRWFRPRWQESR